MSELTYERAKQLYTPYDEGQMRHLCALRDVEIDRLRVENSKLRELVLCLLTCSSDTGDACDRCPVNGGAGIWDFEDFCDSLLDRVHELRIELNA